MMLESEVPDFETNKVPESWGCPQCGERDMDVLDPLEGNGNIWCPKCKIVYDIYNERKILGMGIETRELAEEVDGQNWEK